MNRSVLVVSDLHLGGPDGFQMCTAAGAARLAAFFRWVREILAGGGGVEIVLAGDVVDFLAEPDDEALPRDRWTWAPFVLDEARALAKLERILGRTADVWRALSEFVGASGELTVLLGNHDVELALPRVRRRFLQAVAPDGGRVTFLHDGEAFRRGELLVEHGNRYEGWNAVAHDSLRHVRSALSRGERLPDFAPQPGSRLVAEVMNRIKARYAFVDLLKPETAGVLPILAVLDPALWLGAGRAIAAAARAAWRQGQIEAEGRGSGEFIAAPGTRATAAAGRELIGGLAKEAAVPAPPFPDEDAITLAEELAAGPKREEIGVLRDLQVAMLLRAFRARRDKDESDFDVGKESRLYLMPVEALMRGRNRTVVFGHTHFAKRVAVSTEGGTATYLNTGTWADLMRLPPVLYEGSTAQGEQALTDFLAAVRTNDITKYRRQVPTYARIELDERERVASSNVFFFDGNGKDDPVSTPELLRRLSPERSP